MQKPRTLITILLLSVILFLFTGCQSSNIDSTPSTESSQPTEATEDQTLETTEATEPSTEATNPTETVCPRTIEFFKSHLMPYMTYEEVLAILGAKDREISNIYNQSEAVWYLEDDYFLIAEFFPTKDDDMYEYIATAPTDATKPDVTPVDGLYYLGEWWRHMEAYRATLYKGSTTGKREKIEVWFDYGYGPFWQEE